MNSIRRRTRLVGGVEIDLNADLSATYECSDDATGVVRKMLERGRHPPDSRSQLLAETRDEDLGRQQLDAGVATPEPQI